MPAKRERRKRAADPETKRVSQRPTAGLLTQRPLQLEPGTELPGVHVRASAYRPHLFRKMIERADAAANPGDIVAVYDREGKLAGHGLYNPRSEIVVRMLEFGDTRPDEAFWRDRLAGAVSLRRDLLRLEQVTDAYRVVHAEADNLTGLVVDRFGDTLSAEVFSLGVFQRADALLAELGRQMGTRHTIVRVDAQVHGQEGFLADSRTSPEAPAEVTIREYGTRFRVRFEGGHKTGFFCDQRENRQRLAQFCKDRTVLDLCCYTGGFAIQAKRLGEAAEVTGVDLDEKALEVARGNARLNQAEVRFVHADVFAYMRDLLRNGRRFDVVVLDPPKLIRSRIEYEDGSHKYFDFNRLAMQLVKPGGLMLSCSCSGLFPEPEFARMLHSAFRSSTTRAASDATPAVPRSLQILAKSGAGPDHPVATWCPESEYLKASWMRLC